MADPKLKIALLICSTRKPRVAPSIAAWVVSALTSTLPPSIILETVDLADYPLPISPSGSVIPAKITVPGTPVPKGAYHDAQIDAWSQKVTEYAGFVFVTPQYNWNVPAALKVALDHLFHDPSLPLLTHTITGTTTENHGLSLPTQRLRPRNLPHDPRPWLPWANGSTHLQKTRANTWSSGPPYEKPPKLGKDWGNRPRGGLPSSPIQFMNDAADTGQGFWFANFTVGAAEELILLIDTGSSDVYLNPGVYEPSVNSVPEDENFTITFATTNPDGSGTATIAGPIFKDIVSLDNTSLSISQMPLGVVADPENPPTFPNDGLIGFANSTGSAVNSASWFTLLCSEGELDECRFGLAYQTDDTGTQYFGYVAEERFEGPLSVGPVVPENEWSTYVDVAYDGTVLLKDQWMVTDSGTTVMFGASPEDPTTLDGYFSCSNPPTLGFGIPSISNASQASQDPSSPVSHTSTIFNVLSSQLVQNSTGDNCTASIHGTDEFPFWLIGQVFFQGKYIDHNHATETMGFAVLCDV
ncbi:hypothetical protein B7494_g7863 [Chlorociboria aeruginascens]|nr:hypothetical protein B7494_g7863 [Chlorociboria aeruginascens]